MCHVRHLQGGRPYCLPDPLPPSLIGGSPKKGRIDGLSLCTACADQAIPFYEQRECLLLICHPDVSWHGQQEKKTNKHSVNGLSDNTSNGLAPLARKATSENALATTSACSRANSSDNIPDTVNSAPGMKGKKEGATVLVQGFASVTPMIHSTPFFMK